MPAVTKPANQKGDFLVDYEEKVFEDVQAGKARKPSSPSIPSPSKDRSASSTCCRPRA
jgi:hypothetical protein